MRSPRLSTAVLPLLLLGMGGCGDSTGPGMSVTVERTEWLIGTRSRFRAEIANWDGTATMRLRASFCPNVIFTGWSPGLACAGLEVIEDETVLSASASKTYEWNGCGGSLVFVARLIEDGAITDEDGAVAAC